MTHERVVARAFNETDIAHTHVDVYKSLIFRNGQILDYNGIPRNTKELKWRICHLTISGVQISFFITSIYYNDIIIKSIETNFKDLSMFYLVYTSNFCNIHVVTISSESLNIYSDGNVQANLKVIKSPYVDWYSKFLTCVLIFQKWQTSFIVDKYKQNLIDFMRPKRFL